MSALAITVKTLLADSTLTPIVGNRIYPIFAPPDAKIPNIVVHLVGEEEEELLQGASIWPEARVSIECRSDSAPQVDRVAQRIIDWLRDKRNYEVFGHEATFRKEGSDVTDSSDEISKGAPYVSRRIIDFYLRYRREV